MMSMVLPQPSPRVTLPPPQALSTVHARGNDVSSVLADEETNPSPPLLTVASPHHAAADVVPPPSAPHNPPALQPQQKRAAAAAPALYRVTSLPLDAYSREARNKMEMQDADSQRRRKPPLCGKRVIAEGRTSAAGGGLRRSSCHHDSAGLRKKGTSGRYGPAAAEPYTYNNDDHDYGCAGEGGVDSDYETCDGHDDPDDGRQRNTGTSRKDGAMKRAFGGGLWRSSACCLLRLLFPLTPPSPVPGSNGPPLCSQSV
jgi:hypothetical protein